MEHKDLRKFVRLTLLTELTVEQYSDSQLKQVYSFCVNRKRALMLGTTGYSDITEPDSYSDYISFFEKEMKERGIL